MNVPKMLYQLSEEEINDALNQVPIYIAQWMRAAGIKASSEADDGYDIYGPVKETILKQWEKARKLHPENEDW